MKIHEPEIHQNQDRARNRSQPRFPLSKAPLQAYPIFKRLFRKSLQIQSEGHLSRISTYPSKSNQGLKIHTHHPVTSPSEH